MKRRHNFKDNQEQPLHKLRSTNPSERDTSNQKRILYSSSENNSLRSSIASRLQMLLDAAVDCNHIKKETKHDALIINEDKSLLSSQDFVLSAKNKINELIKKHHQNGNSSSITNVEKMPSCGEREKENSFSENSSEGNSEAESVSSTGYPLQLQITSKLHSIILKSSGRDCLPFTINKMGFTNSDNVFSESQRLHSVAIEDSLNSVQKKFDQSITPEAVHQAQCSKSLNQAVSKGLNEAINKKDRLKISKLLHQNVVDVSHPKLKHSEPDMSNMFLLSIDDLKANLGRSNQVPPTSHMGRDNHVNEPSQIVQSDHLSDVTQNLVKCRSKVTEYSNANHNKMSLPYNVDLSEEIISETIENKNENPVVIDVISDDEEEVTVLENLYVCPRCQKDFRARSLLKFHMQMHNVGSLPALSVGKH